MAHECQSAILNSAQMAGNEPGHCSKGTLRTPASDHFSDSELLGCLRLTWVMTIAATMGMTNSAANDLGTGTVPSNHDMRIDTGLQDRDDQSVPVGVMRSLRKTAGKKTTTGKRTRWVTPHRLPRSVPGSSLIGLAQLGNPCGLLPSCCDVDGHRIYSHLVCGVAVMPPKDFWSVNGSRSELLLGRVLSGV